MDRWSKLFQTVLVPASQSAPHSAFAATEQATDAGQADRMQVGTGPVSQGAQSGGDSTEFGLWCMRTTLGVLDAIHSLALRRGQEFEQQTGQKLSIVYPAEAPAPHLVYAAREMHFMKFSLAGTDVHVYSARNPDKLPAIHIVGEAGSFRSGGARGAERSSNPRDFSRQRLVSNLLCRVAVSGSAGYALISGKDGKPVKMDELVFSVFSALLKQQRLNRRR